MKATEKRYLKKKLDLIGRLGSNNTTKIGMLPSASKYVLIKFANQCLHNINSKEILNGLKGSSKFKRENNYSNIN